MNELSIVAVVTLREGAEYELRSALAALVAPPLKDPGYLRYEMYADRDEPRRFVVMSRWTDEAAYTKHDQESAHIRHWAQISQGKVEKAEVYTLESIG